MPPRLSSYTSGLRPLTGFMSVELTAQFGLSSLSLLAPLRCRVLDTVMAVFRMFQERPGLPIGIGAIGIDEYSLPSIRGFDPIRQSGAVDLVRLAPSNGWKKRRHTNLV